MLAGTVTEASRRFGDTPALVTESGWSLSFADLDRRSDELAVGLSRRGVAEGDVVALLLPASPDHFVAYAAAAKLGAVTAAVNPRLTRGERAAVLGTADPRLLLTTPTLAATGGLEDLSDSRVLRTEEATSPEEIFIDSVVPGESPPPLAPDPTRPIAIVFTSGTTGIPKGAVFTGTQIGFIANTDVGPEWGGGGKLLAGSALAHLGPMTKFAGNLRRGSTQYLTSGWKASAALRRVADLGISVVGGVPTQLALMLAEPDFDSYELTSVQAIIIGGGPATSALIREARARFGVPLAVRYSCTEAGIGTGTGFADPEQDAEVSVGRPQPGVAVHILDEHGTELPAGEIGEVVLSSPAVMSGYWHDAPGSAAAFAPNGGVRTGDLGSLDDLGRLRLAGRNRERYVRGGFNVYPMEVEGVLADHPDLSAVAIVGRTDPVMGEVGVAVVVVRDGSPAPTVTSLRSFGSDRLASYKLPNQVLTVPALPLTAMDKIDRAALQHLVADPGEHPDGTDPP